MKKIQTNNEQILEAISEYTICNAEMEIEITNEAAVAEILKGFDEICNDYYIYSIYE